MAESEGLMGRLAPVIENINLIRQRCPYRFEMGYRSDDLANGHIPRRIVVEADDHHTGVRALRDLHYLMQIQEIVMVFRHQDQ